MTGQKLLARNAVLNLIGQGAPGLVAIITIPILIERLGTERFGAVALIWVVLNYASLLDFGIGRALTKSVADLLGVERHDEIPKLVVTGLLLTLILGIACAAVVGIGASWLVQATLELPGNMAHEAVPALRLLALTIPFVVSTASMRGSLEAYQRFDLLTGVRIPLSVFTFVGPLLVLPYSHSLVTIVGVLAFARVLAWLVHIVFCFKNIPGLKTGGLLDRSAARALLSFGGWLSISNMIGPLLLYMDRFLLAGMVSVAAVAFYTTPYEAVTHLWFIPRGIIEVIFPAFGVALARDVALAKRLYLHGIVWTIVLLFPLCLAIVVLAEPSLQLWLGSEFAERSSNVARLLALGVFLNGIGLVSSALVQAAGRPDLTAKLHLIEFPFYIFYLYALIKGYGIDGAAAAWLLRVGLSAVVLAYLAISCLRIRTAEARKVEIANAVGS